jgi:hypothetical protein
LIDLFLPKNQHALDGKLAWCKQNQNEIGDDESALANVISTPAALTEAIEELKKFKLIRMEGRELWAHRVVQEAVNYQEKQDLQESFNAAALLVYEAFPKSKHGDYFSSQAAAAQAYIHHAAHLSRKFASYSSSGEAALLGSVLNIHCTCP